MRRRGRRVGPLAGEAHGKHAAFVCRELQVASAEGHVEVLRHHADLARTDDLARPGLIAFDIVLGAAQVLAVAGHRAAAAHHAEITYGASHDASRGCGSCRTASRKRTNLPLP